MICRRCGNRIPEYLTTREYFQCPECGRQFGNPPAEREQRYERRSARYEPEYDDSPADDRYYDDGQGYYEDDFGGEDGYYDDGYYDDPPYEDDGYYGDQYDDQPYEDGYYEEDYYDDFQDDFADDEPAPRRAQRQPRAPRPKKPKGPKRTMKLVVLLYVLIVEVVLLIVVACIGAGMNSGEPAGAEPTDMPAAVVTTRDPNATESPYPVV